MIYYIIFALATAIHAMFSLVAPVLKRAKDNKIKKDSIPLTYTIFFVLIILIAPVVVLSCIIPSMTQRFQDALYEGLFDKE